MRIFLTGASGFIGSAIIPELIGAGHQVLGLARSDASAKSIIAAGAEVHLGSLDDIESLKSGAAKSDGVIHTAFIHAFSNISIGARLKVIFGGLPKGIASRFMSTIAAMDSNAIAAMGSVLAGSGRPLVITSGTMILPLGRLVNENDKPDPKSPAAYRMPSENIAFELASQGVRSSIVRLPPTVHGDGDHGFVPSLIKIARKKGVSAYVNEGKNHWPAVHRLDAARLFRLALEKGTAGTAYHGVADEGIPFHQIASIIAKNLDLPLAPRPEKHFGFLGSIVAADNMTSSALTKQALGWQPTHSSLIADLDDHNRYFENQ
ncbi:MAG: SDR family oxidoreductase [Mucilaginibacter sp.]|uniref:SDR family oxidoreductase n=1 Tax=Mucilaginibacter sp. TaxID=1882438 RepID=UPI0034E4015A